MENISNNNKIIILLLVQKNKYLDAASPNTAVLCFEWVCSCKVPFLSPYQSLSIVHYELVTESFTQLIC